MSSLDQLPVDAEWVAVDTETSGTHPDDGARVACVTLAWYEGSKLQSLGLPFDQGVRDKLPTVQLDLLESDADPNLDEDEWRGLLAWLREQRLVFHNAKYDLTMMRAGTREWVGLDLYPALAWDTLLVQRELDPLHMAGLDAVSKRLGIGTGKQGLDELKNWLKRHKYPPNRYDLVPWSVAEEYAITDAELTAELFAMQLDRLEGNESLRRRIDRELRLLGALYYMEGRGVGYDAGRSLEAADLLESRAKEIEDKLPFPATNGGAKSYFFGEMGLLADRVSEKTGEPSLDEEQVRKWVEEGVEHAEEYSLATKARRAVSMWYRGYPEKIGQDGRLRTEFNQSKVKSGRMSVSRVQLQALPKKDKYSAVGSDDVLPIYEDIPGVRELVRPREGYGLWSLDLSQAELRVAAQYSQCRGMLEELLSDDPDIHGKTTQNVLGADPDDPMYKFKRDVGKRLTFGGIFMVGAETFQATLSKLANIHMPLGECYTLVHRWRSMYPEIEETYRKAERMAKSKGFVRLLPNTEYEVRSYFSERDWPRTAWNRIVQGSLAEAFKLLILTVEEGWPGYQVLTIHDSVVMEMPLDEGDRIAAEVAAAGAKMMTELFRIEMSMDTERW